MPVFATLLPAAGRSTRFGSSKIHQSLGRQLVIARAIGAFLRHPDTARVIIAAGDVPDITALLDQHFPDKADRNRLQVVAGGEHRAASVRQALLAVPQEIEWVAVHDAARPLLSQKLLSDIWQAAQQYGAAVPALPVHLTIKQAHGPLPAKVLRTVPRSELWAMQTPQMMRRADLLAAFEHCPIPLDQVTDDVQLLELAGHPVYLVPGEERNLKITTPIDLRLAEHWLNESN